MSLWPVATVETSPPMTGGKAGSRRNDASQHVALRSPARGYGAMLTFPWQPLGGEEGGGG